MHLFLQKEAREQNMDQIVIWRLDETHLRADIIDALFGRVNLYFLYLKGLYRVLLICDVISLTILTR